MLSGISIWQLLILLVIVLLLFGTKKLKNIGTDLGGAIKGFKNAMAEGQKEGEQPPQIQQSAKGQTLEGEASHEKEKS